jgi:hypothetical protein
MTYAACRRVGSLTIRQIAESKVIRIRHGGLDRAAQTSVIQKDEVVMVRTIEWRAAATGRIISVCPCLKTTHVPG